MPRGDRTGPWGNGPLTGRGAGYCAGYDTPGYMNPMGGRGGGAHFGFRGRGRRHWRYAAELPGWMRGRGSWGWPAAGQMTAEQEMEALERQAAHLERSLAEVNERLKTLRRESRTEK